MPKLRLEGYERKRLSKIARACKPGSILDLGYAQSPNPYFEGPTTGVDLKPPETPGMYDEELSGDVERLADTLQDRRFDNISAGELIEHLERPYDFLRSLREHLAPKGRLILSTPNPIGWPCLLFEWLNSHRFYYSDDHKYYFTPRWVVRMLNVSGYSLEKMIGVGFLAPLVVLPCPATVSYQVIYIASANGTEN